MSKYLNSFAYLCDMIFYFSGTGNTRWAADTIARKTGERLVFIPEETRGDCHYTLSEGERIGFCFPVHGWQPPGIVRRFISRLTIANAAGHYCFAVCTCGDNIGETMTILNKDLSKRGLRTDSAFSIIMPETYVCLPFMYTDTKEREREKIETAEKELDGISEAIIRRATGVEQLVKGATPGLYSYVIGEWFNKRMITDRPFNVDENKCVKCGICAGTCPVDNIIGGKGSVPEWRHGGECTCCLACYHHCPVHAINYGKRTRKRGQYYFKKQ